MEEVQPMEVPGDGPAVMAPPVTAPPADGRPVTAPPAVGQPVTAPPAPPPADVEEDQEALVAPEPELPPFVFALGRVEPRFPSLGVEKEFAQAAGRGNNGGLTDREALHSVLADRANRYLVRQICWVFLVEGLETYILGPRDPADFDLLVETVRAAPDRGDVDVVVGERGPVAPSDACNGLTLPLVAFDQIYSFDRGSFIESIPRPEGQTKPQTDRFESAAGELFDRVMQVADNAGSLDEHRALNYLAVRYPAIYATTAEAFGRNASLTGVEVRPSRLSGQRKVFDVIFSYTSRETDVMEKYFARVDVTEKFPFLVTRLAEFYDR
jgi:PatG C-terminal